MNRFNVGVGLGSAVLLLSGCVKLSKFTAAQAQLADAQQQLTAANEKVGDLQKQLDAATAKLTDIQAQLTAAKVVPVHVGFRRAPAGPGFVAVLTTTIKRELPVTIAVVSHAFGTTKTFQVYLQPLGQREIGHAQGLAFEDGDELRITNPDFEPLVTTFHPGS